MSAHQLNQQNIHKHTFMLTLHYSITAKSSQALSRVAENSFCSP